MTDHTQPPDPATARVRTVYDRHAGRYDRMIAVAERLLFQGGREWATAQACGDTLEIAVGTGLNLPLYADDVRLVGVELSPQMLRRAQERAGRLGRSADLRLGDAQRLDLPDASFDVVVSTLTLCSIPDDAAAVREAARVLRPGGRLVLLEHVASPSPVVHRVEQALEPLALRLQADHLTRRPEQRVAEAGLAVQTLERSRLGITLRLTARKPA